MTKEEKNIKIKETLKMTREKRCHQTCKVFKIKIDESSLSKRQKEELKMLFVEAKWIVNSVISWSSNEENKIWEYKLEKEIVHKDKDFNDVKTSLKYLGSQMKQAVLSEIISNVRTLASLKKKGNKIGKLKFRKEVKEINLKQYGNTYKILSKNKIKIQNISGTIRVNGLKQFANLTDIDFANAKLLNTPSGYYLAITIFMSPEQKLNHKINETIGIDFGCATSFSLSNCEKINCMIEESERLKKLQRRFAKTKKGSNNRYKLNKQIKKEYQHITNKKDDLANKIFAKLNQYECIVIQDEQLQNWQKSGHGKVIQHSVLGKVKSKLVHANNTKVISKWIPTSKTCSNCGKIHDELTLKDRIFICDCGIKEDRDIHAAKNMIWFYNIVGVGRTNFKRTEIQSEIDKFILSSKSNSKSMKCEDSTL